MKPERDPPNDPDDEVYTFDCRLRSYGKIRTAMERARSQLEEEHGVPMMYVGRSERAIASGVWVTFRFMAKKQ